MQKIKIILLSVLVSLPFHLAHSYTSPNTSSQSIEVNQNQEFRDMVIAHVRSVANNVIVHTPLAATQLDVLWNKSYQIPNWSTEISVYYQGTKIGRGNAQGQDLAHVVQTATENALKNTTLKQITGNELAQFRFKVSFDYYPTQTYSFIEFMKKGLELLGNRVAVRVLDVPTIKDQVANSQEYLLNVMHPSLHGFFKFYDAGQDKPEEKLRTIYSASSLYTFLKLYKFNHDPKLEKNFKPIAKFILSMQVPSGPHAGGFYYSYDPASSQKQCRVVVGTTSKTIFTLLELYRFYNDDSYLTAAKKAGDWLLTMVKPDGNVTPIAVCKNNDWHVYDKQSFLYSGQVLSALSRLYAITQEKRYYNGATKVANHFKDEVKKQNIFVGDDFRPKNSISTSWVLMSMIDYAKINNDNTYLDIIRQTSAKLLSQQITDNHDAYTYGRYRDAITPSGNGWINEVMGVLYDFCQTTHFTDCNQYRKPMILTTRWLLQNAYTKANTYDVKNPERAIGGFITNFSTQTVRTDAVCHGVNSLLSLLAMVSDSTQPLLTVPERPLAEILPSLRAGRLPG
ncbi:glycoside hydrolase family 76 protein [Legionella hackeliae]|uniref:Putative Terpenoid cylase/protein prenyltransferase-domain-containing protein n=1 Tax=Legionella hackeliae TaxID=449 RepID=A0A0A8UKT2_LEGHA|nr:glycoside hydrolase family 76 protein [Legionella hackeliae]KTD14899.1 Glycosyl hydrolase family 76 [Legionella hackeliae]CEK09475.1 putative Terpenoid cylase/protein prenyltransferase-domain-containing protein [Legionella hackeliae]STX49381.1 Predicted glycosyl hydrolase [Legionella hackeliae]